MTEKYSKYELVSPDWLNEDFFTKILTNSEDDSNIKVTSLKITPATVNNDHYGSLMYRARIGFSTSKDDSKTVSWVVKTMPEMDSLKKDMLGDTFIFKTEIRMYSDAIPKMEAILRKYGDDTILGAKVVYSAMEPHQVIVFEDLVEKGFSTLKNRAPTEEEIKRAMLKIAKWHAVSYKLAQEDPESMIHYNDGTLNLDLEKIDFFVNGIKNFIEALLSSEDELKEYIPLFEEFGKTLLKRCSKLANAFKSGDKAIFVLNHGDFHFKNMMFKHKDTGEFDDLMLVDFQMCYYGPAVSDLMYSMYMLWDEDTRMNRRDEMIYYYFSNFIDSLKKYEYKGVLPTMGDLQIDLINYRFFETFLMATFLPFTVAFVDDTTELDKLVESPEYRNKLYHNTALLNEIKKTLPRFLRKGYLE